MKVVIYHLPIYLVKYCRQKGLVANGQLKVPKNLTWRISYNNSRQILAYDRRRTVHTNVKILMACPSKARCYSLFRHLEGVFREEYCRSALEDFQNGFSAKASLEHFFNAYNISEEEYSHDRAYKNWQRYSWQHGYTLPARHPTESSKRFSDWLHGTL